MRRRLIPLAPLGLTLALLGLMAAGCGGGSSSGVESQAAPSSAEVQAEAERSEREANELAAQEQREARQQARARRKAKRERERKAIAAQERQEEREAEEARRVEEESEEVASSECDPNYSGACLDPYASDYDCAGGSGNGPEYTGPVTVVGEDHYGLDADGDGSACESY